jgi:RimJ/RimL family protein N-acetyltransferase
VRIEAIDPSSYDDAIAGLAALLVDAVEGGASVNFLAGVTRDEAGAWWASRSEAVRSGTITVFVARDGDDERIVGSTLLERSRNQNSPHRAEIGKVIVHRSARRRGIAT